jgi:hypothetical protein
VGWLEVIVLVEDLERGDKSLRASRISRKVRRLLKEGMIK